MWATPCFPGHLGHQLPITATAPSLSDKTAHNESSPRCACCSDTTQTLSIHPSITSFLSLPSPSCRSPQRLQVVEDVCVCVCVAACGLLTDVAEVQDSLGHHRWVSGWWWRGRSAGGLPLSLWCVTSAAALSPTNGAVVEPCKESPAEVLFESAWGQWGTAGSV